MNKCLLYVFDAGQCAGFKDCPACRCNGETSKCDFYPEPWKQKKKTIIDDELIAICRDAREACFARRCATCKHNVKGFPQCQDHMYAAKFIEHADQIIQLLKEEPTND